MVRSKHFEIVTGGLISLWREVHVVERPPPPSVHLQADDVSVTVGDFLHDAFLPVLPAERPGRTVAVQLSRGVLVTQHVVAHDSEHSCRRKKKIKDINKTK